MEGVVESGKIVFVQANQLGANPIRPRGPVALSPSNAETKAERTHDVVQTCLNTVSRVANMLDVRINQISVGHGSHQLHLGKMLQGNFTTTL